nr:hypothetical protein [Tanacetum cinerariifolium]
MNSEKLISKALSQWSNPNRDPTLGRSCKEELGTFAGEGTGVCCRVGMIGVGGRGRVFVDNRGIEEIASANWFVCMNSEKLISKALSQWSNPNRDPTLGRSCKEELGTFAGEGTGVCCRVGMIGVGGRGRVVVDNRGRSAVVVTRTSTRGVDSVLRLKIESIPAHVSKILPKIEKTINEQLEAEVLTRSSNSSKTSYVVAANLSELELKKILIKKMESNKSIHDPMNRRISTKLWLTLTNMKNPSLDQTRGPREDDLKELESTSAPKENTSKTTGKSTEGSKSHHKSASEYAPAEELMHTTKDLEEPAHQEFDTCATDDQPVEEASQHPDWFQKQAKPPTHDHAWNKILPTTHGPIQP